MSGRNFDFSNFVRCSSPPEGMEAVCKIVMDAVPGTKVVACRVSEEKIRHLPRYMMPFGKYRGKDLSEIPTEYLQWCAVNLDKPTVVDYIKRELEGRGK